MDKKGSNKGTCVCTWHVLTLKDTQDYNKVRSDKEFQQIRQTQHKHAEIRRDSCGVTCP